MKAWNVLSAREVLDVACRAGSVPIVDLELIHFSKSAVFRLGPDLVARVSRPGVDLERIAQGMGLARWLCAQGFPVARPISELDPVPVHGSGVSFWRWAETDGCLDSEQWARLLLEFHYLAASYPEPLPRWQPLRDLAGALRDLESSGLIGDDDAETLWRWQRHLEGRLAQVTSDLGLGPIHGNAHRDNARSGPVLPILFDLDLVCQGPREWDLVAEAVAPRRFAASRQEYERFSQTYGYSVTSWSGFADAVLARELLLTVFRIGVDSHITSGETESERRMSYWRGDPQPAVWRGY